MNRKIQSSVFSFDELEFLVEPCTRTIILALQDLQASLVEFDLTTTEIRDIAMGVVHASFFMKVAFWLKTNSNVNGRQWYIIQSSKTKFYFTSFWPFETS
jgi:hypothetical protein